MAWKSKTSAFPKKLVVYCLVRIRSNYKHVGIWIPRMLAFRQENETVCSIVKTEFSLILKSWFSGWGRHGNLQQMCACISNISPPSPPNQKNLSYLEAFSFSVTRLENTQWGFLTKIEKKGNQQVKAGKVGSSKLGEILYHFLCMVKHNRFLYHQYCQYCVATNKMPLSILALCNEIWSHNSSGMNWSFVAGSVSSRMSKITLLEG